MADHALIATSLCGIFGHFSKTAESANPAGSGGPCWRVAFLLGKPEPKGKMTTTIKLHSMPDEYYERGLKLIAANQRAYKRARTLVHNARAWAHYDRTAKRLTEHENAHNCA